MGIVPRNVRGESQRMKIYLKKPQTNNNLKVFSLLKARSDCDKNSQQPSMSLEIEETLTCLDD